MKFVGLLSVLLILSAGTSMGQDAKKWKIDKSHASVNFSINHFFSEVTGRFKEFDGDIYFDKDNLGGSKASFTIKVASVDTDNETRDKDIQSDSFFDAPNNPDIKFVSTKIVKKDDKNYTVHGNLSMRGKTKKVELPMRITGVMDNPWAEGSVIMGVQIKTTLNRTEWGVGTGSWAASTIVSDEVDIKISMELDGKKSS